MHKLIFLSDMATVFVDQLNLPWNSLHQFLKTNEYLYDKRLDGLTCLVNEHIEIPFLLVKDEDSILESANLVNSSRSESSVTDNSGQYLDFKVDFHSIFTTLSTETYCLEINLYELRDLEVKLAKHINPELIDDYYLRTEPGLYPDLLRRVDVQDFVNDSHISFRLNSTNTRYVLDLVIKKKELNDKSKNDSLTKNVKNQSISKENFELKFKLESENEVVEESYVFSFFNKVLEESSYKHTEWFHTDCLADFYQVKVNSDEYFLLLKNFAQAGREIHMNTIYVPLLTPALDIEYMGHRTNVQLLQIEVDGDYLSPNCQYKFDFTYLKKYVKMMQDLGYQYFEICHLFSQWGAKFAIDIYALVNGEEKRIFDNSVEATDDRYIRFVKLLLAELKLVLEELNIKDRAIFHLSDEPSLEHLDNFQKVIDSLGESIMGLNRIDALSNYDFYNRDLIKEPVIALNELSNFVSNMKDDGAYWIYYCVTQAKDVCNRFMSMPLCRQRSLALVLYLQDKAIGFLHWGFNFYNSQFSLEKLNPYESVDAGGKFIAGDAFLFYPGNDYQPEWSIRAMTTRQIFEDLAKLELLEIKLGRERIKKELETVFDYSRREFSFAKTAKEFKLVKNKINQLLDEIYRVE